MAREGASHGSWVSALEQTQGRGRQGRHWESLSGNLMLTLIIRDLPKTLWTWAPLATALGVVKAVQRLYPKLPLLQVKWPNDLLLKGRKVGGILCEGDCSSSATAPSPPFLLLGLGLNRSQAPRFEIQSKSRSWARKATSLEEFQARSETGRCSLVPLSDLRSAAIAEVLTQIDTLMHEGPESLRKTYIQTAYFKDQSWVTWRTSDGRLQRGQVQGLGSHGELLVGNPATPLYAEDVHLESENAHSTFTTPGTDRTFSSELEPP